MNQRQKYEDIRVRAINVSLITLLVMGVGFGHNVSANERAFGDMGKPADYDQTIKHFRQIIPGLDKFAKSFPSTFDWREQGVVTPADDQGQCGGCWAFASVGVLESKILMHGSSFFNLSEQQQISCNSSMNACGGGDMSALTYWNTIGPMEENWVMGQNR